MRHFQGARAMFVGFLTILLLTAEGMVVAVHRTTMRAPGSSRPIRPWHASRRRCPPSGLGQRIEAEDEGGQQFCEVKIVDAAGYTHKLHIDVYTHQVIKVN